MLVKVLAEMNRVVKYRLPFFKEDGSLAHFSFWGTIDHKGEPSLDHGCFSSPGSSTFTKGWHERYIGLRDKEGKEYFVGDLFKIKSGDDKKWMLGEIYETEFETRYRLKYLEPGEGDRTDFFLSANIVVELAKGEIIGHIHENLT